MLYGIRFFLELRLLGVMELQGSQKAAYSVCHVDKPLEYLAILHKPKK